MSKLSLLCRNATALNEDGSINEDAFRRFLQRFVDAKIGLYLASAGSGEGGAMTAEELLRVYRIGVDVCKGKVQVNGNPPEKPTVRETLDHIRLAIEGGVEIVNVYGPPGWHAFRPTDEEYAGFFDELLREVKHPVAIAPNPTIGYSPKPALIADICHRHHQIVAVNLVNQDDDYFIELKDRLKRDLDLNVPIDGSLDMLLLGARGVIGGELNMLPKTYRRYLDLYEANKFTEAALVYADLKRFNRYVTQWRGAHPRWIKMMMKAFGMPGWGIRGPYRMPGDAELRKFSEGLLGLGIPEIDELAREAKLK
jgi:dihydrodipicolinate synthase/N-acetylneuraminate lyase